jgi:integrase
MASNFADCVKKIEALKPRQKKYLKKVALNLYIKVAPSGLKTWVVRYSVNDQQIDHHLPKPFGSSEPFLTLSAAKLAAAELISLAKSGVSPKEQSAAQRLAKEQELEQLKAQNLTVGQLFESWIDYGVRRQDNNADIKRSFNKDVLPAIGQKPLRELTEFDLRRILGGVVARGSNRSAVQLKNLFVQMLTWAEKRKPWRPLLIDGNPAQLIEIDKIVDRDYKLDNIRRRVLSEDELRELKTIFYKLETEYQSSPIKRYMAHPIERKLQLAVWICLSTLCRIGALLHAKWEHIDFDKALWQIPAENDKSLKGREQDQVVSLSAFALRQFIELKTITGSSVWCYPNTLDTGHLCVKTLSKQIGDRQEMFTERSKVLSKRAQSNLLVLSKGKKGNWVMHDLRRTGATMMQMLGVNPDVIDRCQSHIIAGSKVRRHYLQYDFAKEKKDAWDALGDRLDIVLNSSNVVNFRQSRSS